MTTPYNPLDKLNLARSIENELLHQAPRPLGEVGNLLGAGVYVIYYTGDFKPYLPIATANADENFAAPIYIGKAIPKGGRKGGLAKDASKGRALRDRLRQHAGSIEDASNLDLADFHVRHLIVDDIWIPLGENMLIETFKPLWNRALDGFGNKAPGRRRHTQYKSPWDVLHPGRRAFEKLADSPQLTPAFLEKRVADYLAGRPLDPLPKAIQRQQDDERAEAEEDANEA